MTKVVLEDTASGYAISTINNNFETIESELNNKVLYRANPTGEPNQMENLLDMNTHRIINLRAPVAPNDAARFADIPFDPIPIGTTTALLTTVTPFSTIAATNAQGALEEIVSDLSSTASLTQGAGTVGFLYSLNYVGNTVGRWLKDLATSAGSTFIGFIQAGAGAVLRTVQAKLRELPTPEDYGAVGDGVADDSAAFSALFAAHSAGFGKPGSIYLIKDMVLNGQRFYGRGCVIRPATGARWLIKLKGYRPELVDVQIQDSDNYSRLTTCAAGAIIGATTIQVASATGFEIGQVLLIEVDASGYWVTTEVTNVAGAVITFRDALVSAVSIGKEVRALYAAVWIEDASYWVAKDIHVINARGAFLAKPSAGVASNRGSMTRCSTDGARSFGLMKMNNAAGIKIDDLKLWCGYVDTVNLVGNGTAGPFSFNGAAFLLRDVTVTVDGVAKTYPTHWTFASSTSIQFTPGNFPAGGAAIVIDNFRDGVRGFVEDQRNTSIISGGNDYGRVEVLDAVIGVHAIEAELTDFDDVISDTISGVALQMDSCANSLSIQKAFLGFSNSNLKAFNTGGATIGRMYTARAPSAETVAGVVDDNVYVDATSRLDIEATEWNGGDYQINGPGIVNLRGALTQSVATITTVAAATTVYLTDLGQQASEIPTFVVPWDTHALELVCQCNTAPGAAQTFTYQLRVNGVNQGSPVVITGAASFSGSQRLVVSALKGDNITLRLVTSAGAAAALHRCVFVMR